MAATLEETYFSDQFILCIDTQINKQDQPRRTGALIWFDLTQSSFPAMPHGESSSGKCNTEPARVRPERPLEAVDCTAAIACKLQQGKQVLPDMRLA